MNNVNFNNKSSAKDHCGIVGIFLLDKKKKVIDIPSLLSFGLYALQHRGQEGYGVYAENKFGVSFIDKRTGFVNQPKLSYSLQSIARISANLAIGQTRYSTSGELNAWQPFHSEGFTLVHNGNITNAKTLYKKLPRILQETVISDTDIVFKSIISNKAITVEERIINIMSQIEGAGNFIMASGNKLYAYRDPWGFRPLILGKLIKNSGFIVSSEDNFYNNSDIKVVREINPGEGVIIDNDGVRQFFCDKRKVTKARCIFELAYISAPDSTIFGKSVYRFREKLGRKLAAKDFENKFLPDIVVPVQHSGLSYATGYCKELRKNLFENYKHFGITKLKAKKLIEEIQPEPGLIANIYAGRVFILPNERYNKTVIKQRPNIDIIKGKKVLLVDDSIVRSTTSKSIVELLKKAGALQIHLRIGCPPISSPCFMGIDFATEEELIANRLCCNVKKIEKEIDCDSLVYMDTKNFVESANGVRFSKDLDDKTYFEKAGFCGACFCGNYSVDHSGVWGK